VVKGSKRVKYIKEKRKREKDLIFKKKALI
jgi:hypothetical protein